MVISPELWWLALHQDGRQKIAYHPEDLENIIENRKKKSCMADDINQNIVCITKNCFPRETNWDNTMVYICCNSYNISCEI